MFDAMIDACEVGFGREANEQLAQLLRDAKSEDVFASACVIVPSNYVAVTLRRELATGDFGATSWVGKGLVGTDFLTSYRLAEAVAGHSFLTQGRQPIRGVVIGAAIRQILTDSPGIFEPIAHHGATERELVRVYRELRDLEEDELNTLASSGERSNEVVRVYRASNQLLQDQWFDEFDLFRSTDLAAEKVSDFGKLVLFLPQQLATTEIAFLSRLSKLSSITAILGLTGAEEADHDSNRIADLFGTQRSTSNVVLPSTSTVISVSDPDDEVKTTVRSVIGLLDQGVTASQIAVLYPQQNPYARQLEEHLNDSAICFSGVSSRTIADSMLGRFISSLLNLPDQNLNVKAVLNFLSNCQTRLNVDSPLSAPSASWSQIAMAAGVTAGLEDWSEKLSRYKEQLLVTAERERARTGDDDQASLHERKSHELDELLAFVIELNRIVDPKSLPTDWAGLCSWLRQAIERYLGPNDRVGPEKGDFVAVEQVLDQLHNLARVEPTTTLSVFRRSVEAQLEDHNERIGKLGQGVFVGDIRHAWGLNFEHTFILGLAEGTFPSTPRKNGVISDDDRVRLNGALSVSSDVTNDDHRRFLAALSASSKSTLLFPRGDLRQHKENYPARWLEQMAERMGATSLDDAWDDPQHQWAIHQSSFIYGLRNSNFPAAVQEFDLVSLLDSRDEGRDLTTVALNMTSSFEAGRQLIDSRDSQIFTRFDGNLSSLVNSNAVGTNVLSPTRLQQWANCPHGYFMRYVLGVEEPESFRHEFRISPLTSGFFIHEAADRFFRGQVAEGTPPGPDRQYSEDDILSMRQIGIEVATELETQGLVGRPLFWSRDRDRLLNDLVGILKFDDRREHRGTVVATELKFGLADSDLPPLRRKLPSGRTVLFRGSIDRVEKTGAGDLVVVDYKTGKLDSYKKLDPADPTLGGSQLQLPLYAVAASSYLSQGVSEVHASYWFTSDSQRWTTKGYLVSQDVLNAFDEAIEVIVDGIEGGLFPPKPTPSSSQWTGAGRCVFCDPDELGTRHIEEKWKVLSLLDSLAPYTTLRGEGAIASDERADDA